MHDLESQVRFTSCQSFSQTKYKKTHGYEVFYNQLATTDILNEAYRHWTKLAQRVVRR